MDPINAIAILITLAALFVCINYHFLKDAIFTVVLHNG